MRTPWFARLSAATAWRWREMTSHSSRHAIADAKAERDSILFVTRVHGVSAFAGRAERRQPRPCCPPPLHASSTRSAPHRRTPSRAPRRSSPASRRPPRSRPPVRSAQRFRCAPSRDWRPPGCGRPPTSICWRRTAMPVSGPRCWSIPRLPSRGARSIKHDTFCPSRRARDPGLRRAPAESPSGRSARASARARAGTHD